MRVFRITFECKECGDVWSDVFDESYFENIEDLETVLDECTMPCPDCGEECFAIECEEL